MGEVSADNKHIYIIQPRKINYKLPAPLELYFWCDIYGIEKQNKNAALENIRADKAQRFHTSVYKSADIYKCEISWATECGDAGGGEGHMC